MCTAIKTDKRLKCPKCCPEFSVTHKLEFVGSADNLRWAYVCWNCGNEKPCRELKDLTKPTPAMQRTIDALQAEFGGTVEIKMIGRKAWVVGRNEARSMFIGNTWHALVASSRSMEFTIYRIGGDRTAANLLDALCLM